MAFPQLVGDRQWLNQNWKLCTPLLNAADVGTLIDWLSGIYSTLAMTNYPYSAGFLVKLPAYPVKVRFSVLLLHTLFSEKTKFREIFFNFMERHDDGKYISHRFIVRT